MRNIKFVLVCFLLISYSVVQSQNITIQNLTTAGHFNTCSGGLPVITVTLLSGSASSVVNGTLVCDNPTGFSNLRITMSNILWDQTSSTNWMHGLFFPASNGITITAVNLPPGWIYASSCTGASCSIGATGGRGFYFDGTASSSCCAGALNDGNPANNYGDGLPSCSHPFNLTYDIKIANSALINGSYLLKLSGTSDGSTGCWNQPDPIFSSIQFLFSTVSCTPTELNFCIPFANTTITTSTPAATYQWLQSADSVNFTPVINNANFSGSTTNALTISNLPSSFYGYRFKCNPLSGIFTLKFRNIWTGSVNSNWNNPANWSCGILPDENTDVIINSGTVSVNVNSSVRSLTLQPGVVFSIEPGVIFIVTH